jgi:hypothetical protein
MPRRLHLALALILLLVLAPLARASCGIGCLAIPHPATPVARSQPHCVRASTCCHSSNSAICAVSQAPESIAGISTGANVPPELTARAVLTANAAFQDPFTLVTGNIDSSPPGQSLASTSTPLRI